MINISEEQSLDVDSHFISPIRLEYLSLHCLSANTQRKKNTKRPNISCQAPGYLKSVSFLHLKNIDMQSTKK